MAKFIHDKVEISTASNVEAASSPPVAVHNRNSTPLVLVVHQVSVASTQYY
jgi:hypothetical protein